MNSYRRDLRNAVLANPKLSILEKVNSVKLSQTWSNVLKKTCIIWYGSLHKYLFFFSKINLEYLTLLFFFSSIRHESNFLDFLYLSFQNLFHNKNFLVFFYHIPLLSFHLYQSKSCKYTILTFQPTCHILLFISTFPTYVFYFLLLFHSHTQSNSVRQHQFLFYLFIYFFKEPE